MSSNGSAPRRRVVFLDGFRRLGGAEQSLLDLLARIDRQRFDVVFVTTGEGDVSREVDRLEIPTHFCPMPEDVSSVSRTALKLPALMLGIPSLGGYLRRLGRLLKSLRPDVIYSNAMKDHVSAALLSGSVRKPVIWHLRDLVENRLLRTVIESLALAASARLIANSHFTASQFARLSRRRDRCAVVHNGVDIEAVDRLRSEPTRGEVPPSGEDFVVGIVGVVCPEKGQELLIRALPDIAREKPVQAWIIGDEIYDTSRHHRGYPEYLERLADELGVRERVHFLGWRKDVIALIDRMDVLVCASNPSLFVETFGRTVVEAMACGKAVVSVNVGGPREIAVGGETGLLLEDYSPQALTRAVLEILADEDAMTRMGAAGRRRVERLFTIDSYVRGVERSIERFLAV